MTDHERSRLEKLEQFVQRLSLHSHIAKAASEGRQAPHFRWDEMEERLEALERGTVAKAADINPATGLPRPDKLTQRVNGLENDVRKLKKQVANVQEFINDPAHDFRRTPTDAATVREGEAVLAKAQQAQRRRGTPDGILERAMRLIDDPVAIGEVTGYLHSGQLAKAQDIVRQFEERADHQEGEEALGAMERDLGEYDTHAAVSDLTAKVERLLDMFSSLSDRVGSLEAQVRSRPQVAPAPTVAKAQGRGGRHHEQLPSADELMTRAMGVIDSGATIGVISSMLQGGQLAEAQKMVEQAELAHESAVKQAQRRLL